MGRGIGGRRCGKDDERLPWRVAFYIRLSREDGRDESCSVSNQRTILAEYLEKEFREPYRFCGYYIDDGESGTDYERPGFQQMLQDAKSGKINCILCKNLSRAFRNYADQGYFLESFFPRYGIRFITIGNPKVDTFLDPEGVCGLEIPINGLMNDRYAYKTSSDIRRTFDVKRRKGEFIGAFAPYGYQKDPRDKNRLLIDPEAAEVVRDIFQWYVYGDGGGDGGMSKQAIAQKLNRMGIPNPAAYKRQKGFQYYHPKSDGNDGLWQGSSVSAILGNEVYTGTMIQGRQRVISYKVHNKTSVPEEQWFRVADTHEPVIGRELFTLAAQLRGRRQRNSPEKGDYHLFSGLLKCADCRKAMTRKPVKNFAYFYCSTYKRKSKERCTSHSVRQDILEQAVLRSIQEQMSQITDLGKLMELSDRRPFHSSRGRDLEYKIRQQEREKEREERFLEELYRDWKNGDISREMYRKYMAAAQERIGRQENAAAYMREELKQSAEAGKLPDTFLSDLRERENIQALSRELLQLLTEEILVGEDGHITIVYKFDQR